MSTAGSAAALPAAGWGWRELRRGRTGGGAARRSVPLVARRRVWGAVGARPAAAPPFSGPAVLRPRLRRRRLGLRAGSRGRGWRRGRRPPRRSGPGRSGSLLRGHLVCSGRGDAATRARCGGSGNQRPDACGALRRSACSVVIRALPLRGFVAVIITPGLLWECFGNFPVGRGRVSACCCLSPLSPAASRRATLVAEASDSSSVRFPAIKVSLSELLRKITMWLGLPSLRESD